MASPALMGPTASCCLLFLLGLLRGSADAASSSCSQVSVEGVKPAVSGPFSFEAGMRGFYQWYVWRHALRSEWPFIIIIIMSGGEGKANEHGLIACCSLFDRPRNPSGIRCGRVGRGGGGGRGHHVACRAVGRGRGHRVGQWWWWWWWWWWWRWWRNHVG